MKQKKVLFQLALLALFTFFANYLHAQSKPVYASLSYVKTDRNKGTAYVELIRKYGSKIGNQRVKSGELLSYSLFSVGISSDEERPYNFVLVTTANNLSAFLEPAATPKEVLTMLMPGANESMIDAALAQYGEIRVNGKSEIFQLVDGLNTTNSGKFFEISYMKTELGKEEEYVKLEKEQFMPIHRERVKDGYISDWALWSYYYPYSDVRPYNYVTVNVFNNIDKMVSFNYTEAMKRIFPKADISKMTAGMRSARTMVKTEIWKREVYITKEN